MKFVKYLCALLSILCLLAGSACQTHRYAELPMREASDCPAQFVAGASAAGLPTDAARSPMVDPRNGTLIELVRSDRDWGDYQVPPGRYGVQKGELLRLKPATGRPLGIVRK